LESGIKKYKICIVSAILPPAYGGAEVAAFKYANRLNEDPESQVIVIGWDRTGVYGESKVKYDFVHSITFPENPKDAKGILIYFQQINHMWNCFLALIKPMYKLRSEYDYIHNFNSGFAFNRVSILIGKMLGKKVITETSLVGDDDPLSLGRFPDWKDYFKPKYIRYKFYKMADRYVSKSEVITEIFERSEIPMNKVVQIPYSVDINLYKPISAERKTELRKKTGIWAEGRIILFVGGINVRKGVHILLDAFISLEKKYPDLKLVIAGPTYKYDKKYVQDIKDKIKNLNLSEKIILTEDNISNVNEYMQCSDIFILPSRQEGFPISILEAMSSGLIVIGSDIPEIARAQIKDGIDGFVFPSGDTNKLEEVLEKVLKDDCGNEKIAAEARNKVIRNWSTEIVDRSYKELYSSI
jgi:glycosyltransferase involved in cell wall biosynthesis